jgi:hypothetical protein
MSTGPRSFNESELNYFGRAPAFDAVVWNRLTESAHEFFEEHGEVYVLVRLFSGDAFPVSTVSPGITWVKFGLEDGSTRGVAAGAIEQVIVTHRPPEAPKRSVGFTIAEDEPRPESGDVKP